MAVISGMTEVVGVVRLSTVSPRPRVSVSNGLLSFPLAHAPKLLCSHAALPPDYCLSPPALPVPSLVEQRNSASML